MTDDPKVRCGDCPCWYPCECGQGWCGWTGLCTCDDDECSEDMAPHRPVGARREPGADDLRGLATALYTELRNSNWSDTPVTGACLEDMRAMMAEYGIYANR